MELRRMERNGFCRDCDKALEKGHLVFYTHSRRNRGQHIFLCERCIQQVVKMYEDLEVRRLLDLVESQRDGDEFIGHRG